MSRYNTRTEGWDPPQWLELTDKLVDMLAWNRPVFPLAGDPVAFRGTPLNG